MATSARLENPANYRAAKRRPNACVETGQSVASRLSVRIYRPPPALQSWMTFCYIIDSPGPLLDFLYPEWGNVRFALAGKWTVTPAGDVPGWPHDAMLYGPTDRHSTVRTDGGRAFGFGLTPLCWSRLIGGDAAALINSGVPLREQLGVPGEALRRQLIADAAIDDRRAVERVERLVATLLADAPPAPPLVCAVDRALRGRPGTIGDFATAAGVAERTLHRLCRHAFGFSPKRLLRLQRFLDALGEARSAVGRPIAGALGESYCDQSHFYRDFHDFMAMRPRDYYAAPRPLMAAVAAAQVEADVSLSFRLPPQPGAEG